MGDAMADDNRPTLILIHGAGRAGRMWRQQTGPLSAHFTVLTPDLPGFGSSPGPFTVDASVEAIAALIRAQSTPRVHLCGFSLGANVAALVAAAHPDLVDRLLLAAPALVPAVERRAVWFYRHVPGPALRLIADVPDRAAWLAMIDEVVRIDLRPALPRITATTLVVCGRRDRANLADAHRTAEAVPGARLIVVPHVGHAFPVFAPKPFNAIVSGFLTA